MKEVQEMDHFVSQRANTAKGNRENIIFPKPIRLHPLLILSYTFIIALFLSFWASWTYAPYYVVEQFFVQIAPSTPEEEKIYNGFSNNNTNSYNEEKIKSANFEKLPGYRYTVKHWGNKTVILGVCTKHPFTYNETMRFLMISPVLPLLLIISFMGFTFYLCRIMFKFSKTLHIMTECKNFPKKKLPSPILDSILLALPVFNFFWVWPVTLRAAYYGKKLSLLYKIPYKGPAIDYTLTFCLLILISPILKVAIPDFLFVVFCIITLIIAYYYMKQINSFIADVKTHATFPD